jgi:hypothetical protein
VPNHTTATFAGRAWLLRFATAFAVVEALTNSNPSAVSSCHELPVDDILGEALRARLRPLGEPASREGRLVRQWQLASALRVR